MSEVRFVLCQRNCVCERCGGVRMHITKTVRRSKKPRRVDHAALALSDALRAMVTATVEHS